MKTSAEYVESLRRMHPRVYLGGKLVESVPDDPQLQSGIRATSIAYSYAEDPALRDLTTVHSDLTGQTVNRLLTVITSKDDLLKKLELSRHLCRVVGCAQRYLTHDALNALYSVTYDTDKALGTGYHPVLLDYMRHMQREDLTIAVAMTDGKGDRSKRPSEQEDPDLYVRIVSRDSSGIVVRGAKAIVTGAPYVHDLIVMPTRSMQPDDKDYAVCFATPVDARGIEMVARVPGRTSSLPYRMQKAPHSENYAQATALVMFDNVFVPWDRVFLAGEHQFAGAVAGAFAGFHRHTCIGCRAGLGDMIIGAAASMVEANGLSVSYGHLGERMAELIRIVESFYACGIASSVNARPLPAGNVMPDEVYSNVGKQIMGERIYDMFRLAHEMAGGIVVTAPEPEDAENPAVKTRVDRYLQGRADVPTSERLKLARFLEDVTASYQGGWYSVISLHGGGSPAAETIEILRKYALDDRRALVRGLAGLEGGERPRAPNNKQSA
ncbi:MAG: 4-hydroxyphenylacetate 3-hydroxylase [Dehalococcoidia bacterium]|nr:4-hydroxyphenylacetate 3-hydroxylase [Dehalococcoidia bacterium]